MMLCELARDWYRIQLDCSNPDCRSSRWLDGEWIGRFARRFPDMDLMQFRMICRCEACDALCGVKVKMRSRAGRKGRGNVIYVEDRSVWRWPRNAKSPPPR